MNTVQSERPLSYLFSVICSVQSPGTCYKYQRVSSLLYVSSASCWEHNDTWGVRHNIHVRWESVVNFMKQDKIKIKYREGPPKKNGFTVGGWGSKARSLKSTTTATMVGGPKEFGGTKGMLLYLLAPPKSLFCPSNSIIPEAVFIIMSKLPPKVASHVQGKVRQASWPFVDCHETLNKALNDEEIVYFGTILMIKTCFGTKLMIKTWFTHFLSLVQFVAIYALLGGPIRP